MHSILETEKSLKLTSSGQKYKKKQKKNKKLKKLNKKNPLGWFFLNLGYFLPWGKVLEPIAEGAETREEENTAADEEDNDHVEDDGESDDTESGEKDEGEQEIDDKAEVKEEPLPEFPDTDVKIQYDR
jgi:hypothetical protein